MDRNKEIIGFKNLNDENNEMDISCPFCYIIIKTREFISQLEEKVNNNIEDKDKINIPYIIINYLYREYDMPDGYKISITREESK